MVILTSIVFGRGGTLKPGYFINLLISYLLRCSALSTTSPSSSSGSATTVKLFKKKRYLT